WGGLRFRKRLRRWGNRERGGERRRRLVHACDRNRVMEEEPRHDRALGRPAHDHGESGRHGRERIDRERGSHRPERRHDGALGADRQPGRGSDVERNRNRLRQRLRQRPGRERRRRGRRRPVLPRSGNDGLELLPRHRLALERDAHDLGAGVGRCRKCHDRERRRERPERPPPGVAQQLVSPGGVTIQVYSGVTGWTAQQVYDFLEPNAYQLGLIGPHLTIKVQTTCSTFTTTSAGTRGGVYTSFNATMYL